MLSTNTISTKILGSTAVFNITTNMFIEHIRMISKGSCDTKNWSNDAENSTLHHRNKLLFFFIIKIKSSYFVKNTSQYYCFYCIFDQINAASVSIQDF